MVTIYANLTTVHPMWLPAAVKAAQQGNAKGLHRPPGYENCGYTVSYMARNDGTIRWALSYRFGRGKHTTVATWTTDWLPLERARIAQRPINPPDRPIRITSEGGDWLARVVLDSQNMPRPIPVTR